MHILLIHQAFAALDEPGGTRHHELARSLVKSWPPGDHHCQPDQLPDRSKRSDQSAWIMHTELEAGIHLVRCNTYHALHRSFIHRVTQFFRFHGHLLHRRPGCTQSRPGVGYFAAHLPGIHRLAAGAFERCPFPVRSARPVAGICHCCGCSQQPFPIVLSEWLERFLYRRADRVVINSPGFEEHVRQRGARHRTGAQRGRPIHVRSG